MLKLFDMFRSSLMSFSVSDHCSVQHVASLVGYTDSNRMMGVELVFREQLLSELYRDSVLLPLDGL